MNTFSKDHFSLVWPLIFLVSLSLIIFEISLTRIFSLILSYHFVFLAVSTGILGLGIGGMWGAKIVSRTQGQLSWTLLAHILLLLATSLPLTAAALLWLPHTPHLFLYGLIAMIPFIFGGIFFSMIFAFGRQNEWTHNLYFADLTGAALGSLLVILLVRTWGPFATTAVLGTVIIVTAIPLIWKHLHSTSRVKIITCFVFLTTLTTLATVFPEMELKIMASTPSSKPMFNFLDNPEHEGEVIFTRWSIMARTDVVQTNLENRKAVFTDGAAPSAMFRFSGDISEVEELTQQVGYIPFLRGNHDHVLSIGPGAGKDVLMAILADTKKITAVEINAGIVEAVRHYASFNGGIFDLPQVEMIIDDGRSFIRRSSEKYDLIYLSLVVTDTADPVGYSLIENYIYTTQAFHNYLDRLDEKGQLAFIFHDQNDLLKGFNTALFVLNERGISYENGVKQLAMINGNDGSEGVIHQPLLLVQNEPLTSDSAEELLHQTQELNLQPLFIPFSFEQGVAATIGKGELSLAEFIEMAPLNIQPTTDNRPFFYNFDKGLPPYLFNLLMIVIAIILIYFVISFLQWEKPKRGRSTFPPFLGYFTSLGVGFMLVEIPLILQLGFFLGRPTIAISITLFSLLAAGGIGSTLGPRMISNPEQRVRIVIVVLVVLLFLYLVFLPGILDRFLLLSIYSRILLTVLFLAPIGFLLGIPFPTGLSLISKDNPKHVSLMWGVNGLTSVLGSVLAIVFSLLAGFQLTLAIGILFYLTALGSAHILRKSKASEFL